MHELKICCFSSNNSVDHCSFKNLLFILSDTKYLLLHCRFRINGIEYLDHMIFLNVGEFVQFYSVLKLQKKVKNFKIYVHYIYIYFFSNMSFLKRYINCSFVFTTMKIAKLEGIFEDSLFAFLIYFV